MTRESRVLHLLTGPTAVGKTELALRWAEAHDAEIVSCDSLLFYRGMDVGTAKPTAAELARVPHHLIDVCAVDAAMDITRYVALAQAAVAAIAARGRAVLVTGGSGFYLKSFLAPVADAVAVPPELRLAVQTRLNKEGLTALVDTLHQLNPGGLGALDTANPRRVTRALERCLASGRTLRELAAEFAALPAPFAGWTVQLTRLERPPAELDARITARVQQMLAGGLIEEVRALRAQGLERNPSAARAIGYRETLAWLDAGGGAGMDRGARTASQAELATAIVANTRALVRKQATWFRTQLPPHTVQPAATAEVATLFEGSDADASDVTDA